MLIVNNNNNKMKTKQNKTKHTRIKRMESQKRFKTCSVTDVLAPTFSMDHRQHSEISENLWKRGGHNSASALIYM